MRIKIKVIKWLNLWLDLESRLNNVKNKRKLTHRINANKKLKRNKKDINKIKEKLWLDQWFNQEWVIELKILIKKLLKLVKNAHKLLKKLNRLMKFNNKTLETLSFVKMNNLYLVQFVVMFKNANKIRINAKKNQFRRRVIKNNVKKLRFNKRIQAKNRLRTWNH